MNLRETQELFWKAARHAASAEEIKRCFLSSSTFSAQRRAAVYEGAYFVRQEKALRELLPKTHELLGADFSALARRYILAHPGRHAALEHFTNGFGDFLAQLPGHEQASSLGRLEVARNLALRAPPDSMEPLTLAGLQALSPLAVLRVSTHAQLIAANKRTFELFSERSRPFDDDSIGEDLWLLFLRKGFSVRHRVLANDQAQAIEKLQHGTTLAELCETFFEHKDPAGRAHRAISAFLNDQILISPTSGSTK